MTNGMTECEQCQQQVPVKGATRLPWPLGFICKACKADNDAADQAWWNADAGVTL